MVKIVNVDTEVWTRTRDVCKERVSNTKSKHQKRRNDASMEKSLSKFVRSIARYRLLMIYPRAKRELKKNQFEIEKSWEQKENERYERCVYS